VSSIGAFIESSAEIQSAAYDASLQSFSLNYVSKKFFKLELIGIFTKILVTVANRIIFSCESNGPVLKRKEGHRPAPAGFQAPAGAVPCRCTGVSWGGGKGTGRRRPVPFFRHRPAPAGAGAGA